MKIKRYEVYNMKDALTMIKQDLGSDAVILTTRKIMKSNVFGLFSKPIIEITAAVDYSTKKQNVISTFQTDRTAGKTIPSEKKVYKQDIHDIDRLTEMVKSLGLKNFEGIVEDIREIKKQLGEMQSTLADKIVIDLDPAVIDFYYLLIKNGLDEIIAYKILKKIEKRISLIPSRLQIKEIIMQLLEEIIPLEPDYTSHIKNRIMTVIGPTGVGKTTTIAKIAATLAIKKHKKVCLVSIDTFRIGAIEQLRTYADIIDVPKFGASKTKDLKDIIKKTSNFDYILMDSIGRSQYELSQIKELLNFIDISPIISTIVVLSLSGNHSELYDTFDKYKKLEPESIIFTKLDETKYFGPLINLPIVKKVPILLLTNGQNVPEDIESPHGRKIAKYILNEIPKVWGN